VPGEGQAFSGCIHVTHEADATVRQARLEVKSVVPIAAG